MAISPQTQSAKDFLRQSSDIPTISTLRQWVENDLKRSIDDVIELLIQAEVTQAITDKPWKEAQVGDDTFYTVTFSDKMSAGLLFDKDNMVIAEIALTQGVTQS